MMVSSSAGDVLERRRLMAPDFVFRILLLNKIDVDQSSGKLVSRPRSSSGAVLNQVRTAARPLWQILIQKR